MQLNFRRKQQWMFRVSNFLINNIFWFVQTNINGNQILWNFLYYVWCLINRSLFFVFGNWNHLVGIDIKIMIPPICCWSWVNGVAFNWANVRSWDLVVFFFLYELGQVQCCCLVFFENSSCSRYSIVATVWVSSLSVGGLVFGHQPRHLQCFRNSFFFSNEAHPRHSHPKPKKR